MKKFFSVLLLFFLSYANILPITDSLAQTKNAVLFLSPNSGSYTVNSSFSVKVAVNSGGGTGINAAEGLIKFDNSFLTVTKVADTGSIFKLWTTDPTFSNSAGTISFGGGSPGPYTGNNGTIFTISFTSKKAGTTAVNFTSGIVLAADGKGTNVFSGFGNASFNITEAQKTEEKPIEKPKAEEEKPTAKGLLPPLPEVSSETHPETDIWYMNNHPQFSWKLLADLIGVSYDISTNPTADPGAEIDGIIEDVLFEEAVPDGEQYFHIKYKNKSGWGQIAHRKLLVDATPPKSFNVTVDNGGDETNPVPQLRFKTIDEASSLDYYKLNVNEKIEQIKPEDMEKGYYQLQPLAPGEYLADIAAFDKAGNVSSSTVKFLVEPLRAPIITSIPKTVNSKEELVIRGTSFYPRVNVKIFIMKDGNDPIEASVKTDDDGNWSYFRNEILEKGNYEVWAKIVDDRGAQSSDSTRYILSVISLSFIERFSLWIIILLLTIIVALVLYIIYQRREYLDEKRRIMRETEEVKVKLAKIFMALREEVDELIEMADKKPGLSDAERRVKERLQESLDISEEFINKEVTDVEKEIKLPKKK
ncbi:MAG: hypothetical protein US83_C0006G0036 [Candidatus Falkowbacteria bacterium GW2011_GWC2_38_22]|uniref:Cohesin domain-containing protein n=1 Tax=Candidatus Falkowbacteria bacterium GW2011_GWE1_38_31 TaxID=1618638 RepID=A0A0G0N1Y9_9BACT|nr:MAG: hypothetical protein US73_C0001G0053 [Candidatus Falkowbacteria bacterium GW2011_GWF2_38_1205]KKQ61396.1 MAG: hypothetical protein US83_C0006G0036 [Candidatus Falkowbacteria bacterium GW2011_GWC2_38_22]KKQ64021.1 MAG: hypothetical protein US84_C0002G0053 [Candidatus Falkowbacteria bacterium GW2011_GWF1_38_22]KKQ66631.1 MAG: hypothetical protein US87_C0001G0152 [Candidatus Falkowbacteria bacterium GW2011_GWE2_38_254]KKQ71126.1 MAG: hypothetical protein US91_C0001G0053 [Candidatus Falkowb